VKKILVIVATVVVLGGAAGGAWWWTSRPAAAAPKEVPMSERGLLPFEPFLVNLSDAGGNRFLKVTLQLVLDSAEAAAHVQETPVVLSRTRSAVLELLTEQSADALVTPAGKVALKEAIRKRAAEALEQKEIVDVLFSEFVVQF
jgi:flagellar FliL protein